MRMGINQFFDVVLGARTKNPYSWGSTHPRSGDIYLRVWEEDFSKVNGDKIVRVLDLEHLLKRRCASTEVANYKQRKRHVEAIRNGQRSFCVVCRGRDQKQIIWFDRSKVLVGGDILCSEDSLWLTIDGDRPL